MRRLLVRVVIAASGVVAPAAGRAQDLNCRGVAFTTNPTKIMIVEVARRNGDVLFHHARLKDTIQDMPILGGSRTVENGVTTFGFDRANASVAIPVLAGPGAFRGTWIMDGQRHPMTFGCSALAPLSDSVRHAVRFIEVQRGVRLEVLDWGGAGRPVILLHGMSGSGHDFDRFAPQLAAEFRVVAITRRGAGRSSEPDTGYSTDRLAADVLAVADSLGMQKPLIAGHSLAGGTLSAIAARAPDRIAGLIYLDAGYPYAYIDSAHVAAYAGKPEDRHTCPCSSMEQLEDGMPLYRRIRAPVLAIYAMDPDWDVPTYVSSAPWSKAQQSREFEKGVPTARVVRIPNATHYVFDSNPAQVVGEIRAFVAALPSDATRPPRSRRRATVG